MNDTPALRAQGLVRAFGGVHALRDVSFEASPGEVLGFLGPNGAGKSTVLRILTGLLLPDGGRAWVAGRPTDDPGSGFRALIGYLPEHGPAWPDLDVGDFLAFAARMRRLGRGAARRAIERVVATCELEAVQRRPLHVLSKGFRQRVALAQALLHDPPVLLLDEPTSGLDPNQVRGLRALIRGLGGERTVLFSSHALAEVQAVADRVVILHEGRVVADGPPATLARSRLHVVIAGASLDAVTRVLAAVAGVERVIPVDHPEAVAVTIVPREGASPAAALASAVVAAGWRLEALSPRDDGIETVFAQLTRAPR